jgi:ATP-dependent protease HslVU (ClpYQ) peptidase subunit
VADLNPELRLRRVPDIEVRINSDNNIEVASEDAIYSLGPHGLAILDVFYQPVAVAEALKKLSSTSTGVQDWMTLTTTIMQLYEAGILRDEVQRNKELKTGKRGFGSAAIHIAMLNDRTRTSSFLAGIAETVNPEDVVIDIGTGTGVLALAAARAGAKHVYAIEASAIGDIAEATFEANGMADRITLLRGWSTRINLPERADVLVSEIIGNEPLGENVLEVTRDARKRLLKPGARMVPSKVRVLGIPITLPEAEFARHRLTAGTLQSWRSWYGIDFDLLAAVDRGPAPVFFPRPQKSRAWETISEPILLAEVDLSEIERLMIDRSVTVSANTSGILNGMLVYFELDLGPTTRLSTHPHKADENCHWRSMVWVLDPLPLTAGERFKITYQYRSTGTTYNVAVARA